jgi:hypothetical protein
VNCPKAPTFAPHPLNLHSRLNFLIVILLILSILKDSPAHAA